MLKSIKRKSKQVRPFLLLVNQMVAIPLKARKIIALALIQRKALIARLRSEAMNINIGNELNLFKTENVRTRHYESMIFTK